MSKDVQLIPVKEEDQQKFAKDLQTAFKKAVIEEFGYTDEEVIPISDIEMSFCAKGAVVLHIMVDCFIIGGAVLVIDEKTQHNKLDLLYINPQYHSKGMGTAAWNAIEAMFPDTVMWETVTPYFEKRNINFYVNKCGFHIVEFYNAHHIEQNTEELRENDEPDFLDEFFRFEKKMK